jgi:hypothetical protein
MALLKYKILKENLVEGSKKIEQYIENYINELAGNNDYLTNRYFD